MDRTAIVRCNYCGILTPMQSNLPYRCLVCGTAAGTAFQSDSGWLYRFMRAHMAHDVPFALVAIHAELRERGQLVQPPLLTDFDQRVEQYVLHVMQEPTKE
jgi:DNA-directed RNA polymerase subunit RPC12/RpoP